MLKPVSFNKKNYNSGVIILNLFLFRTLRLTAINNKNIKLRLVHIQHPFQDQMCRKMHKCNMHLPSSSLDLGKSLSITSTKLVLDMTRSCPFIFQTTPSPSNFRVPDFFMTVHLRLFQILLLFQSSNNKL